MILVVQMNNQYDGTADLRKSSFFLEATICRSEATTEPNEGEDDELKSEYILSPSILTQVATLTLNAFTAV